MQKKFKLIDLPEQDIFNEYSKLEAVFSECSGEPFEPFSWRRDSLSSWKFGNSQYKYLGGIFYYKGVYSAYISIPGMSMYRGKDIGEFPALEVAKRAVERKVSKWYESSEF